MAIDDKKIAKQMVDKSTRPDAAASRKSTIYSTDSDLLDKSVAKDVKVDSEVQKQRHVLEQRD